MQLNFDHAMLGMSLKAEYYALRRENHLSTAKAIVVRRPFGRGACLSLVGFIAKRMRNGLSGGLQLGQPLFVKAVCRR